MQAGSLALSLLTTPLNVAVLAALQEEARPLAELRRDLGTPPQTTLRVRLRNLTDLGLLERHREGGFPGAVEYSLSASGRQLLPVVEMVEAWLANAPSGPLSLDSVAAQSAIKALVGGWSSTIVRALATRELTLTELDRLISGLNYPSLERRLTAMRSVGLTHTRRADGRGSATVVGGWLRRAVAPLAAAARWERRNLAPGTAKRLTSIDVEAMLLLAVPPLRLPDDLSGSCRLAVELSNGSDPEIAGALVEVSDGAVVSCVTRLRGDASSWAGGSVSDWFDAVLDGRIELLEIGGDAQLVTTVLDQLHDALTIAGEPAMS